MAQELTQETLKKHLHYEPDTGIFTWILPRARWLKVGDVAGSISVRGYMRISLFNRSYLSHRLAVLYMVGHHPANIVDHKNGVFDDNRWVNLREATQGQNLLNRAHHSASGVKNVYKDCAKWYVRFNIQGRFTTFGSFADLDSARQLAETIRSKLHGDFANHN